MATIRVIVYEANPQLREGFCMLIARSDGLEVAGAFKDCRMILHQIAELQPNVLLVDADMPDTVCMDRLAAIRRNFARIKILMLTVFEDNTPLFNALRTGANGYVLKKTAAHRLVQLIVDVQDGGSPMNSLMAARVLEFFSTRIDHVDAETRLSDGEERVLRLLVSGYSCKTISDKLVIPFDMVRAHIGAIYDKMHANPGYQP